MLLLALAATPALAGKAVTSAAMTLREGPGDSFTELVHIPAGSLVDLHECNARQWCRVDYREFEGWVHVRGVEQANRRGSGGQGGVNTADGSAGGGTTVGDGSSGGGGTKGGGGRSRGGGGGKTGGGGTGGEDGISAIDGASLPGGDSGSGGSSGGGGSREAPGSGDSGGNFTRAGDGEHASSAARL